MLQWIKNFPIPLIYLSILLLWIYYAIFSASYLALLGFVFLLVCLFIQFPWKSAGKVLSDLWNLWILVSVSKLATESSESKLADSVERVRILPILLRFNGDSLSFVVSLMESFSSLL